MPKHNIRTFCPLTQGMHSAPRHQEGIKPFATHKLQLIVDRVLKIQLEDLPLRQWRV